MPRLISEEEIREFVRQNHPDFYVVPDDKILSPGARDYLRQAGIPFAAGIKNQPVLPQDRSKYINIKTGISYETKPETMTQVKGNKLVDKDAPLILYRGRLDHAEAVIVNVQAYIFERGGSSRLLDDLDEILKDLRTIMTCEVCQTPCQIDTILGLSLDELRTQSHNTKKYFGVEPMTLPDYHMGQEYAGLNLIRTEIRETELAAVAAFRSGSQIKRMDIIQTLNRLSSAMYIMMCRYLQGMVYGSEGSDER